VTLFEHCIQLVSQRVELLAFELRDRHAAPGLAGGANIRFVTARSPNVCGIVWVRRRSSPNCRSSKLVVRVARRYAIGSFRFAMR